MLEKMVSWGVAAEGGGWVGVSGPLFNTTTALDLMIIRFNHDYHAKLYIL